MSTLDKSKSIDALVSVIIPVFNVIDYLEKSVYSVCSQTYKNLDIILIDDGSTDGSSELCDELSKNDNRIRVIHKKNSGLSDSRNIGLLNMRGKYLTFVDSDDWIKDSMVEEMLRVSIKKDADIVVCESYFVYGSSVEKMHFSNSIITQNRDEAMKTLVEDRKFKTRAWGKIYKRSVWENVYFPHGEIYEDVSTIYKTYLKSKRIALLDNPMYFYNQREGSIVHSGSYKTIFSLLTARISRRNDLKRIMPNILVELNASIITAVLDIYREAALSGEKLSYSENKYLKRTIFKYMGYKENLSLSPRYKSELFVLLVSGSLYYNVEKRLDRLIIHIKRMGN